MILQATPVRTVTRRPVFVGAAWIAPVPPRIEILERAELAPGVWIIRTRRWLPAAALDIGVLIPVPEVEPVPRRMPHPTWKDEALCRGHADADELFFGVDDAKRPALAPTELDHARSICRACPVIRECLTWALTSKHELADGFISVGERYGVWGGTTGRQRRQMFAQIKAGIPVESLIARCLR